MHENMLFLGEKQIFNGVEEIKENEKHLKEIIQIKSCRNVFQGMKIKNKADVD